MQATTDSRIKINVYRTGFHSQNAQQQYAPTNRLLETPAPAYRRQTVSSPYTQTQAPTNFRPSYVVQGTPHTHTQASYRNSVSQPTPMTPSMTPSMPSMPSMTPSMPSMPSMTPSASVNCGNYSRPFRSTIDLTTQHRSPTTQYRSSTTSRSSISSFMVSKSNEEELRYIRGKGKSGKTQVVVYSKENPDVVQDVFNDQTLKVVVNEKVDGMKDIVESMSDAKLNIFLLYLVDIMREQAEHVENQKKMLKQWKNLQGFNYFGISDSATEQELKRAYFRMSMILHPDKGGCPQEFAQMKELYHACLEAIRLRDSEEGQQSDAENSDDNKDEDENSEDSNDSDEEDSENSDSENSDDNKDDDEDEEDEDGKKKKKKDPNTISWEIEDRDEMLCSSWALRQQVVVLNEKITGNYWKLIKMSKTHQLIPLTH